MTRGGGQILVDQLVGHGAELAFGVPGESYLPVLDALHDSPLRLIVARHEAGAANMAEAYGKLTGRPGICLVTRGPGATHAAVGVHTAFQDSTPMLLLVGQVTRSALGREGFQELDLPRVFGGLAKWAAQIDDVGRIPEIVAHAWSLALSGRPGPVVLALPEDVLADSADVDDAPPHRPSAASPGAAELGRLAEMLREAERPLAIVGEGGWSAAAARDVAAFAEAQRIPVAVSFRCQDYVDNRSPVYAGHAGLGMDPALARRIREADLLLAIGGRLGEVPSDGYTLLRVPAPAQQLVHVHPDPDELGAVYQPELGIVSGLPQFAAAARAIAADESLARREALVAQAHADWERWLLEARELPGELQLSAVIGTLRERLPPEAIVTCGAGNFTIWVHRYYRFTRYPSQLAPQSGAMGYGFPAAVAAAALHPDRPVVCISGDGDFLMTGQELATAVQERLSLVVLVVNNGMYGTIRMHQERRYPGRRVGTDLVNPDFAAYAQAFGAYGAVVEEDDQFAAAFEQAMGADGPALLELRVDPEAITPRQTLAEIRAAAG